MNLLKSIAMKPEERLALLAEKVIAEHSSLILEQLGLATDNDGILERITASREEVTTETPAGLFSSQQRSRGFMGRLGVSYIKGSGEITLYPITAMHSVKGDTVKRMPFASAICLAFSKMLEKQLIFVLAHELRHYWQYYTGTVYEKGDYTGSARFMPYSMRWEEKDADQWALEYLKSLKK